MILLFVDVVVGRSAVGRLKLVIDSWFVFGGCCYFPAFSCSSFITSSNPFSNALPETRLAPHTRAPARAPMSQVRENEAYTEWWAPLEASGPYGDFLGNIKVPIISQAGWHDIFLQVRF
jgi:hypothetical protein